LYCSTALINPTWYHTGWAKKVSLTIFAVTLSVSQFSCCLAHTLQEICNRKIYS